MNAIADRLVIGGGKPHSGDFLGAMASRLGCEAEVLAAIVEVESSGSGFDEDGRVRVLFEKHKFYRHLSPSKRADAVKAGLARKKWVSPAKGGYSDQPDNLSALRLLCAAIGIDEAAALKSASYGAGQVLGENFALCGWASVQEFVLDMCESEDNHARAIVGFIEGRGLADEMRERDFDAIARAYNGPGQVAVYSGRMRDAYARIAGRAAKVATAVRAGGLRIGSSGYRVEALQRRLNELGYAVAVDGDFGPAVRRAVIAFQADHGLALDGIVGPATDAALDVARPAIAPEREEATVADLRKSGSTIIKEADRSQVLGTAVTVGAAAKGAEEAGLFDGIASVVSQLSEVKGVVEPLTALVKTLSGNWWVAAAVIGAALILYAWRIKRERLADHRQGRTV